MKLDDVIRGLQNKCASLEYQRNACLSSGDLEGYEKHTAELEETKDTLAKVS